MNSKDFILIIEPDRIVGWDLQLQLESNEYNIFQAQTIKLAEEFKYRSQVKCIIVALDKIDAKDFMQLKNNFYPQRISLVGISSGTQTNKNYEGIEFVAIINKPFDSKNIVSQIEKCCSIKELK